MITATWMTGYQTLVEDALVRYLPVGDEPYGELIEAMRYAVLGGGKRIRAVLAMLFCESLGGSAEAALPAAAAVEMVHAYSLIHDDLPCMDDDDMRRGRPSTHMAFGEAMALLAGDALQAKAFAVLADAYNITRVGAEGALAQVGALAEAVGPDGMVGGQVLDVEPTGGGRTLLDLEMTDRLKTGALIRASAQMGCIAAGADAATQALATQYAAKIGLAFQIVDDVLDVYGDADAMGKRAGRDQKQDKTTYLTLLGKDEALAYSDRLHGEALTVLEKMPLTGAYLYELTEILRTRMY